MAPTYYQIELSGRLLTVLLIALALLMVVAFGFGYGAAWSVLAARDQPPPGMSPVIAAASPTAAPRATPTAPPSELPTPIPTEAPPLPTVVPATPTVAVPTAAPATPRPSPTQIAAEASGMWVQLVAVRDAAALEKARRRAAELGFPASHQRVVQARVAGGDLISKLQVGPFPDRVSADRVQTRMREAGFEDAWVVPP